MTASAGLQDNCQVATSSPGPREIMDPNKSRRHAHGDSATRDSRLGIVLQSITRTQQQNRAMNDNVIKFRRKETPKPPRQTPPWMRKALVITGLIVTFVLAFLYFYVTGDHTGIGSGVTQLN